MSKKNENLQIIYPILVKLQNNKILQLRYSTSLLSSHISLVKYFNEWSRIQKKYRKSENETLRDFCIDIYGQWLPLVACFHTQVPLRVYFVSISPVPKRQVFLQ